MTKKELLAQKMNTIAKLFGAETGTKTSYRCRGKYAGTSDYYVTFDNGIDFWQHRIYYEFKSGKKKSANGKLRE